MKPNKLRLTLGIELEKESKRTKSKIWLTASEKLLSSRKNRASVNIGVISRNSKDGSSILVPGKVLGGGKLAHKVTVAAFSFSNDAKEKITGSGGKYMTIKEFIGSKPKVKEVRLLG